LRRNKPNRFNIQQNSVSCVVLTETDGKVELLCIFLLSCINSPDYFQETGNGSLLVYNSMDLFSSVNKILLLPFYLLVLGELLKLMVKMQILQGAGAFPSAEKFM
jgi:hypothetical protein